LLIVILNCDDCYSYLDWEYYTDDSNYDSEYSNFEFEETAAKKVKPVLSVPKPASNAGTPTPSANNDSK
jgi:hypothetical protein